MLYTQLPLSLCPNLQFLTLILVVSPIPGTLTSLASFLDDVARSLPATCAVTIEVDLRVPPERVVNKKDTWDAIIFRHLQTLARSVALLQPHGVVVDIHVVQYLRIPDSDATGSEAYVISCWTEFVRESFEELKQSVLEIGSSDPLPPKRCSQCLWEGHAVALSSFY